MKRAKEVIGALWALATIVVGFYSFAHAGNIFLLAAFIFFTSVALIVIGYQMLFWTEDQFLTNRRKYWGKGLSGEESEKREIKEFLSYYRFRGVMGILTGLMLISFLAVGSLSYSPTSETDKLVVQALQNKLDNLEKSEVSYYLNQNGCKKLIYAHRWYAEPRTSECGAVETAQYPNYNAFTSETETLFRETGDLLHIGGMRFSEARIDYSDKKIRRAEFFSDPSISRTRGYLYESQQEPHIVEKNSDYEHLLDNWFLIHYHPSPF